MLKRIPIVLDTERDADLLRWLEKQPNRSAAVRRVLRAALDPQPPVDARTLRRILREELRRVAIATAEDPAEPHAEDADPDAGARLDALF
jgi:hypothetical protein